MRAQRGANPGITRRLRVGMAVLAGSIAAAVAPAAAPGDTPAASATARDLSGMWWIERYEPALTPADGRPVPYTRHGRTLATKNAAAIRAGTFEDPPLTTCLLPGLPRAMLSPYPLKIVQHGRSITFIHEQTHAFWHAIIGVPRNPDPDSVDSAFMGGEAVGQWAGDTLVIESRYFKANSYLDDRGMPHSEDLTVVQRLRRSGDGKHLEALITITDPEIFTRPWTARRNYAWRPDVKLAEYVCGEPKRVLPAALATPAQRPGAVR